MITLDEDALICDFAETYQIYDYRALPASYAATLAVGLRDNSRIKSLMADRKASVETIMLASIVDRLSILLAGENATLIARNFINTTASVESFGFESGAEFEAAWAS